MGGQGARKGRRPGGGPDRQREGEAQGACPGVAVLEASQGVAALEVWLVGHLQVLLEAPGTDAEG